MMHNYSKCHCHIIITGTDSSFVLTFLISLLLGGSRTRVFTIIFVMFHKVESSTTRYFENLQSLWVYNLVNFDYVSHGRVISNLTCRMGKTKSCSVRTSQTFHFDNFLVFPRPVNVDAVTQSSVLWKFKKKWSKTSPRPDYCWCKSVKLQVEVLHVITFRCNTTLSKNCESTYHVYASISSQRYSLGPVQLLLTSL